jgi:hypothetical protein
MILHLSHSSSAYVRGLLHGSSFSVRDARFRRLVDPTLRGLVKGGRRHSRLARITDAIAGISQQW